MPRALILFAAALVSDAAVVRGDDTRAIIDLILEHHVDPPTRQEMLLATRGSDAPLAGLSAIVPGKLALMSVQEYNVMKQVQANRYVGTGIYLGIDAERKLPVMRKIFKNGPAARAGARDGDLIESIDGKDTTELPLQQAIRLLRGPEGSRVTVVLRQPDAEAARTLTITRGVAPLETVADYRLFDGDSKAPIAYLRFSMISGSAVHELRQFQKRLRDDGVRSLVLDFRRVGSGSLHHTVLLADGFLDGGSIGRVRSRGGTREHRAERDCLFPDIRLAILVDRYTAGASEWLAAALQDNRRAIVVGERTAGNGFVRTAVAVPGGKSVLYLATGLLERADGSTFLAPKPGGKAGTGGIVPDYDVDLDAKGRPQIDPVKRAVSVLRERPGTISK